MVRIVVNGALGQMGREILSQATNDPRFGVIAGVDRNATEAHASGLRYPLLADIGLLREDADVLIDFSHSSALPGVLRCAADHNLAVVIGTTNLSPDDVALIKDAASHTAIFKSPNMSFGVAVLNGLVTQAAKALVPGYDVEIVETHHRRKLDAPSGTALMLAASIAATSPDPMPVVLDRSGRHEARASNEIGVSAVRGGTIAGEHTIGFYGTDESIELKHSAQSRRSMAAGALRAALYMSGRAPGLYTMTELLAEQSLVTHINVEDDIAVLSIGDVPAAPEDVAALFAALGQINVDMISATTPKNDRLDLAFSLPQCDLAAAVQALSGDDKGERYPAPRVTEHLAKLTVEGEGMAAAAGVTARVFACLAACGVSPCQVTTSETKITMAVDAAAVADVVAAIRSEFGLA